MKVIKSKIGIILSHLMIYRNILGFEIGWRTSNQWSCLGICGKRYSYGRQWGCQAPESEPDPERKRKWTLWRTGCQYCQVMYKSHFVFTEKFGFLLQFLLDIRFCEQ